MNNKITTTFFISFIFISGVFCSDTREQIVANAATNVSENDLLFFAPNRDFIQITYTSGFGYSQHLIVGGMEVEGKIEVTAFFQSYTYEPKSKSLITTRKFLGSIWSWEALRKWGVDDRISNTLQGVFDPFEDVLDGGELYVRIRRDGNEFSIRKLYPKRDPELWSWVEDMTASAGVTFEN